MKHLLILSVILFTGIIAKAGAHPVTYRYVIQFNSQCCGVPDAAPLMKAIQVFKKKNKIKKITYFLISPMGREGEYHMAFPLTELTKKQTALFIKQMDSLAETLKDKGSATTEQNMVVDKQSLSSRTTFTKKTL